mgnify:CR=1 FL=1
MPQTPNHGYNVPNKGDQNWHQPLNDNFEQYDTDIELRDTDSNKSNYTPKQGAKFLATDTGIVYEGDGGNWNATLAESRYSTPSSSGAAGNLVAGHASNNVGSGVSAATIAGGGTSSAPNEVTASSSTVGGGKGNRVTGGQSVIAGGVGNAVSGLQSVVVGGNGNAATGGNAAVGGGASNRASGTMSTVPGGDNNEASGDYATVGGGQDNTASGQHATVAGGTGCSASAPNAFAAGTNASADHEGSFIWSDTSSGGLTSLNPNEFAVSAAGGVYLYTNQSATTGVELPSGSGSWSSASSRALKSNVDPVDAETVLDGVADLEIATWNYDAEGEDVRHMGPMAEDFSAAFGLGDDDGRIGTVDADGVAFAAIQALSEEVEEKDDRIDDLESTLADQRDEIETLRTELDDLRAEIES